jgi:hypothetical protein
MWKQIVYMCVDRVAAFVTKFDLWEFEIKTE